MQRSKIKKQTKKIVVTGGHAGTTALATIEAFRESSRYNWDIVWVGPKYAVEGKKMLTLEFRTFPQFGVKCIPLVAGRIPRKFTRYTIISLLKVPWGFISALKVLMTERPDVTLSFGGFAGFPVVFVSYLMRIPVVLHEQTVAVGLANKASSRFSKAIAISREDSRKFFPDKKIHLTGNPVLHSIVCVGIKEKIGNPPTIYITGGSRGAQRVNNYVEMVLKELLFRYKVIHLTGEIDFSRFVEIRARLPEELRSRYEVTDFINPLKVHATYEKADIIIARAGANTVSEVLVTGRPTIFIPIPWTRYDEQTKNADFARKLGIAVILKEEHMAEDKLLSEINNIEKNWKTMVRKFKENSFTLDVGASNRLRKLVEEII